MRRREERADGKWKHQVLVPGDFPVGGGRFVESDGLDGHCVFREVAGEREFALESECGVPDDRVVEQAAFTSAVFLEQGVSKTLDGFF